LAKAAGLSDLLHPHRGRHTVISNMIENGVDTFLAMELSCQRSLKAYQTYSKKYDTGLQKQLFSKGKRSRNVSRFRLSKCWSEGIEGV
jgi:site-specific recombinase XerD